MFNRRDLLKLAAPAVAVAAGAAVVEVSAAPVPEPRNPDAGLNIPEELRKLRRLAQVDDSLWYSPRFDVYIHVESVKYYLDVPMSRGRCASVESDHSLRDCIEKAYARIAEMGVE